MADQGNGSLPRWVEDIATTVRDGLQECRGDIKGLRDHVDRAHEKLSGEIATLRREATSGRRELSELIDGIEGSMTTRVADLERWKAERDRLAAMADTAAIAAPKGTQPSRLAALRDVFSKPWPWVVLIALLIVAAVAPGAVQELVEAYQLARGGG